MKLARRAVIAALILSAPVWGLSAALTTAPAASATTLTATPAPAFYTYQAPGGAATAGQKVIALTFDDGPGPYTPQVLSVLQHYGVPATFFEIGIETLKYPQYTHLLASAGYPVQDHTWSHVDLTSIPVSSFAYQIDQTQQRIRSLTGIEPNCVRPPYDATNSTVVSQLAARGLTTMSYSIDPKDWTLPGASTIAARVIAAASPGRVVDMHDGGGNRQETVDALPQIITTLRAEGYKFVSICGAMRPTQLVGDVYSFGTAPSPGSHVVSSAPLVATAVDQTGRGYWLAAADGRVFNFGDAPILGSAANVRLTQPVVGMAATPTGRGYWLVASDGGVFAFGDARFRGSTGNIALAKPIVGMAATPTGRGYWLVASDGGVFAFGDARFRGSTGKIGLAKPIVGMAATPTGRGYWLVASDGGVFAFGDARFRGSTGNIALAKPIVGMAATPTGRGYWLAASDGGVFAFGDAPFRGAVGGRAPADTFFSVAAAPSGSGYLLSASRPQTA